MKAHANFIFLLLLLMTSCNLSNQKLNEITPDAFEDMVQNKKIKNLEFELNSTYIEISLTPKAYQQHFVLSREKKLEGINSNGPHYKLKIYSIDQFLKYYKEIANNIPTEERVDVRYIQKGDSQTVIFNWIVLLMFLFGVFVMFLIVRLLIRANYKKSNSQVNVSVADQLEKLAKLKDQGVLSKEEFESQKKKLLSP